MLLKNPALESLLSQSILREVLLIYMLNVDLQNGDPFEEVLNFSYDLIGTEPPKNDENSYAQDDKMTQWIDDVVDAFSRKANFTKQFNELRHRINV